MQTVYGVSANYSQHFTFSTFCHVTVYADLIFTKKKKKKSTHNVSLGFCFFVFLSSLIGYQLFPTQKEFHLWYIQLIENDLERLTPVYRRSPADSACQVQRIVCSTLTNDHIWAQFWGKVQENVCSAKSLSELRHWAMRRQVTNAGHSQSCRGSDRKSFRLQHITTCLVLNDQNSLVW